MLSLIIAAGLSTGQVYRMESPHESPAIHYRMESLPEVRAPEPEPEPEPESSGDDYEVTIDASPDAPPFHWARKPGGESLPDAARRHEARIADGARITLMNAMASEARELSAERHRKFPRMMAALARERSGSAPEPIIGDDTVMPNVSPTPYTPPPQPVYRPVVQWAYPVAQSPYAASVAVCGPSGCGPSVGYGMAPRRGPIARIFGR